MSTNVLQFFINHTIKKLYTQKNNKPIKFTSKNCIILPILVNKICLVYNGKTYVTLKITENMIGYKLGEFIATRKRAIHKIKNDKNIRIK